MDKKWKFVTKYPVEIRALAFVALVVITITLFIFAWFDNHFPLPEDLNRRALYLEQYVGLVQVIVVGVFVGLVSVIIPMLLPDTRDRFERYKQSRLAYSRAKTAVLYLPDRVTNAEDRKSAFILVENAHRELHFAETFEDVIITLGYLDWYARPDLWILYNYWQITAVAEVLRTTDYGDSEYRKVLQRRLHAAVGEVHKRFGRRGEYCENEKWDISDGSRFANEDKLERKIKDVLKSA